MSENVVIKIVNIAGSPHCTASDDGQKVHDAIVLEVKKGNKVTLSFGHVEDLTSAFLNAAIGQLYGEYSEEEIKSFLSLTECASEDLTILSKVVVRAKDFFKYPDRHKIATEDLYIGDK